MKLSFFPSITILKKERNYTFKYISVFCRWPCLQVWYCFSLEWVIFFVCFFADYIHYGLLLGWLKSSFGFFLMMLQKNPNELLGQCADFQWFGQWRMCHIVVKSWVNRNLVRKVIFLRKWERMIQFFWLLQKPVIQRIHNRELDLAGQFMKRFGCRSCSGGLEGFLLTVCK